MRNCVKRFEGSLVRDETLKAAAMAEFDAALAAAGMSGNEQRFIARLVFGEAITNAQIHRQNGETAPVKYQLLVSPFSCYFRLNYQSREFRTDVSLPADPLDDHHRGIPLMQDLSTRMVYKFYPGPAECSRVDLRIDMLLWDLR